METDFEKLLRNIEDAKKEWESTFDSVGDIITLHDKDYKIVRCNKALIEKLNVKYEDVIGKKCFEVFHKRNEPIKECPMAITINTKKPVTKEIEVPYLGGIFNISSYPRINKNDEFVGAVQVARDVTELKRAEAFGRRGVFITGFLRACRDFVDIKSVLELTTSALAEHLNVSRTSVWFFDDSGDLVCRKLFEYQKAVYSDGMILSGKNYPNYIKAIMDDKPVNAHDARMDPRTKEFLDDYLIPLNIFSILDIPIKIRGKVSGVLCLEQTDNPRYWHKDEIHFANAVTAQVSVAVDRIAERELSEKKLKASEVRLRNIIEKNVDGIVVMDGEKIVRFINPAAERLFGVKAETLIGELFDFPVKAEGTTEIDILHGAGEKVVAEMRMVEIKWEKENAYLASLRDITKQKKLEMEKTCLGNVNKIIAGSIDIRDVCEGISVEIGKHTDFDLMCIMLDAEKDNMLELFAVTKGNASIDQNVMCEQAKIQLRGKFPRKGSAIGEVIDSSIPNIIDDTKAGKFKTDHMLFNIGIRSHLNYPLVHKGKATGSISFYSKMVNNFSDKQFELLKQIAPQLAIAIVNTKLYLDTKKAEEDIRKYSRKLEKTNKVLLEMHENVERHRKELQRLSEKVVSVQEEERKKLSRELHDHTGQALIALKTNLEVIDKMLPEDAQKPREWIKESQQFLVKTMKEVRGISFYLRPPMLDELGLVPTIESYAKDFTARTKIAVNVKSDFKAERLQPEQELSLYRMIQEALTNVIKHSEAKAVQINISQEGPKLVMSVKDDGKGFELDKLRQNAIKECGVGLLGMRERFASTGADFQVHSAKGRGTTLIAKYQIN